MPLVLLRAYEGVLGGLQAEDSLRQSEIIAMGTGQLTKNERNRVLRRWRQAMGGGERNVLRGNRAGLAMLRSMGMVREDGSR
jgi:hypothetical protein